MVSWKCPNRRVDSQSSHNHHTVTCPPLDSDDSNRSPALVGSVVAIICPPGMVLTGPNVTNCMANRQWHPDPKSGVVCKGEPCIHFLISNLAIILSIAIADCTIPVVRSNITLNYSSTLEDSFLMFQCEDGLFPEDVFTARCYRNESWIPNPSNHMCATSSAGRTNHISYC